MRYFTFGLLLFALGCAQARLTEEYKAQLPKKPNEAKIEELTDRWARDMLEEYDSAKFRKTGVLQPGYLMGSFSSVHTVGWRWERLINVPNFYGAYIGWRRYAFLWDGNLIYGQRVREDGSSMILTFAR